MEAKRKKGFLPDIVRASVDEGQTIESTAIEDNLGLARWVANFYIRKRLRGTLSDVPVEDTDEYGDAMLGLIQACKRFNPKFKYTDKKGVERNVRFATYAPWWIRRYIQEGQIRRGVFRRKGRRIVGEEMFFTDIDPLWHAERDSDGSYSPIDHLLAVAEVDDNDVETPLKLTWLLLERIEDRQRRVMFKRYALGKSLDEVGAEETSPISKERVRQIEGMAIDSIHTELALKSPGGWSLSTRLRQCRLRAAEYLRLYGKTRVWRLAKEIEAPRGTIKTVLAHSWFRILSGAATLRKAGRMMTNL